MRRPPVRSAVRRCANPDLAGRTTAGGKPTVADGPHRVWLLGSLVPEPLIFRRSRIKRRVPCAELIYCRSLEALEKAVPALGRMLAAAAGSDGPSVPQGARPFFSRRAGTLTYTYPAIFGSDVQYSGLLSRVLAIGARSLGYQRASARGTEDPRQHWQTGSGNLLDSKTLNAEFHAA